MTTACHANLFMRLQELLFVDLNSDSITALNAAVADVVAEHNKKCSLVFLGRPSDCDSAMQDLQSKIEVICQSDAQLASGQPMPEAADVACVVSLSCHGMYGASSSLSGGSCKLAKWCTPVATNEEHCMLFHASTVH